LDLGGERLFWVFRSFGPQKRKTPGRRGDQGFHAFSRLFSVEKARPGRRDERAPIAKPKLKTGRAHGNFAKHKGHRRFAQVSFAAGARAAWAAPAANRCCLQPTRMRGSPRIRVSCTARASGIEVARGRAIGTSRLPKCFVGCCTVSVRFAAPISTSPRELGPRPEPLTLSVYHAQISG